MRDTSLPQKGLIDILTYWPLYPVLAIALVAYAPGAGLRGSWIGGYLSDIYGLDAGQIGTATLFMAGAMIAGSFIFGAADRVATPRNVVLMSSGFGLAAVVVLWLTAGNASLLMTVGLFMAIGFAASNYPQVINQGRAMMPPELVGRGVTLVNLFSIGGVGLGQMVTARAFDAVGGEQLDAYRTVFGILALGLAFGLVTFLLGRRKEPSHA